MHVMIEREKGSKQKKSVVSSGSAGETDPFDQKLRPTDFTGYIGQTDVKKNLLTFTRAARDRGECLDHTLFYGPPGLGKTTLALILAAEMGTNLRQTAGPALEKPGDLAAILTNLKENDFLFIDEIHRLRPGVEEILYTAMEDFAIDIVVGKGPSARTMRITVPPFTLVGATTKAAMLANPLRDRFGHVEKLSYYEPSEIQKIIERSAGILNYLIESTAAEILSQAARRTPRVANRLLRRMRDFAQIAEESTITHDIVRQGLDQLSVDARGLDRGDQEYLSVLCDKFKGGPVGLSTLAAAMGEDEGTIEDVIEPFLIREGLLQRTPKGRQATEAAFAHMGISGINPLEVKGGRLF